MHLNAGTTDKEMDVTTNWGNSLHSCVGNKLSVCIHVSCVLIVLLTSAAPMAGQKLGGPCPTSNSTNQNISTISSDLICLVPQVYGPGGLVGVDNNGPLGSTNQNSAAFKHSVHFQAASLASFSPMTAEIGTQISEIPITSPASGFIFSFNPSLGVVSQTTQNFGPILTERAETIGRHRLFVGFTYQYFNFDRLDGVNLRSFGAVFHHEFEACPSPNPNNITCVVVNGKSVPAITQDFISTQNRIDLKVHQFTLVGTFGLTDRLDVSIAVPILNVRMDMTSDATIQSVEAIDPAIIPSCCVHRFENLHPITTEKEIFPAIGGFTPPYYNHALFANANSASGVGDVVFRGKFLAWQGERAGVAVGMDARFPTGDEENFLGSGTWGLRPFVAFSYLGRVSPHANVGLQVNGNSILAGDVTTDTKAQLPNVISYAAGADIGVIRRLSISADFIGQALQNEKKISLASPVPDFTGGSHPDISVSTATINQGSIAIGGKVNPLGKLLITANVLFRVNDSGLYFKPAPLVGLSYIF